MVAHMDHHQVHFLKSFYDAMAAQMERRRDQTNGTDLYFFTFFVNMQFNYAQTSNHHQIYERGLPSLVFLRTNSKTNTKRRSNTPEVRVQRRQGGKIPTGW